MAIEEYLTELADQNQPVRAAGLTELSGLTQQEAVAVRDGWLTIPEDRRLSIVNQLSDLSDDNIDLDFHAVFFIAMTDPRAEIRFEAIQGLWEYEGRDLIHPLIFCLQDDEEAGVRAGAALALGRYAVLAEYNHLRPGDVVRVDEALRRAAQDQTESIEVQARAIEAVGARGEPWVRDLIDDAYASGNQRLRVSAIHAMGRNCDPEWLPHLIDNLSDDDPEVRYEAALACGAIGDDDATPYIAALVDDEDTEVRLAAIEALGAIGLLGGSDLARETLEDRADDEDATIREAAKAALDEMLEVSDAPIRIPGIAPGHYMTNGHG